MKIKIFGERNTSTNALRQMLLLNSSSQLHPGCIPEFSSIERSLVFTARQLGCKGTSLEKLKDRIFEHRPQVEQWKHCATNFNKVSGCEETHFVFIVRHPASWALSLHKNPYQSLQNNSLSFEQFLDSRWKTVMRERLNGESFKPLALYEEKTRSYRRFIQQLESASLSYSLVKFEDMILRQAECYEQLKPYVEGPVTRFAEFQKSTKDAAKSLTFYKNYYGHELWKKDLGPNFFSDFHFDTTLLKWMGYSW